MPSIRLMGAHEIRVRLGGISRQRAYQLTRRHDFPPSCASLSTGELWLAADVERWIREHRDVTDDFDQWEAQMTD